MICPTANLNSKLSPFPQGQPAFHKGGHCAGGRRGHRGHISHPQPPAAPCFTSLFLSSLSSPSHSNKWISPLVPSKASPPTPRPLEISPSVVSTHQGIVSNWISFLRGKRVHLLQLAHPVTGTACCPQPHPVSQPLPSTSQPFPHHLPFNLFLSCFSPYSKTL